MSASIPAAARWQFAPDEAAAGYKRPGALSAVARGLRGTCPCCGQAPLFQGWLRPVAACAHCHAPLGLVRADDAPPYFVVFIVAHLVIGLVVAAEAIGAFSVAEEAGFFIPLTLVLCLGLLRPVKGATIGLMMQFGLAGAPAPAQPG